MGSVKIGVPNFFIDKFRIPPFLLPIYQAAGTQYGVRWELLAAINEIETDYGRNLNVSSAGAQGWMQFMPASWKAYGVDGNSDGLMDPYNPVDAIFAAARYLKAAGADTDIRKAVFAYNHADWYVDSVLLRAQVIGGLPSNLVGSLTGLTEGRFPVAAKASYANQVTRRGLQADGLNRAIPLGGANRRGLSIYADAGSPVVAVSDVQVIKIGVSKRLGNFVQVQDAYGNTYTYGRWPRSPSSTPRPSRRRWTRPRSSGCWPSRPPTRRRRPRPRTPTGPPRARRTRSSSSGETKEAEPVIEEPALVEPPVKERLFANPTRAQRRRRRRRAAGVPAHGPHRRRADAGARARPRARPDRHQEAQGRLAGARRHRARPHRQRLLAHQAVRALRDPPGRPRRPADRPEADPGRLEAARVDRDLPRQGQEPVHRSRRRDADDRPDPADEQGDADAARARRPARSRSTAAGATTSRRARSTAACWPRSSSWSPPASTRRSRR